MTEATFSPQVDNGRLVKLLSSTKEFKDFTKAVFAPDPSEDAPRRNLKSSFLTSAAAAYKGHLNGYLGGLGSGEEAHLTHEEDEIAAAAIAASARATHRSEDGMYDEFRALPWAPLDSELGEAARLMKTYGDIADDVPVDPKYVPCGIAPEYGFI